ncbi:hypothetical protein PENSPDRAFT_739390 [Peniophora sp. CONT]|nr:hypothetical protein PENSPDRAFT_739390 [Peniophora sp. CONT]
MPLALLDLNEDVLRAIGEAAALVHPPHWEFPGLGQPHGWAPPRLSRKEAASNEKPYPDKRFCLGWIYLSHVSRRLRTIIIESPALWAKIALALPSRRSQAMLLSRAQQMPLCLHLPVERWRTQEDRQRRARAKSASVRELIERAVVIDIGEDRCFQWCSYFHGHVYPVLRHLTIAHTDHERAWMVISAPNLVSLTIRGTLPLFPSPLPSLRELSINGFFNRFSVDLEPRDGLILRVLSRTPALEKLSLVLGHVTEFTVGNSTQVPVLPIQLHNLRWASISFPSNDFGTTTEIPWSYIDAPDNTSIGLEYKCAVHNWPGLLAAASRQLALITHDRLALVFYGGTIALSVDTKDHEPLGAQICELVHRDTCDDILRLLPAYIHVANIQHLTLTLRESTSIVQDGTALHAFLTALPNVTLLVVETDERTSNTLYKILADSTSSHSGLPAALPSLHTLIVHFARVLQRSKKNPNALTAPWAGVILFIQSRADAGGRLRHLIISGDWKRDQLGDKEREAARFADERMMSFVKPYVDDIVDNRVNK